MNGDTEGVNGDAGGTAGEKVVGRVGSSSGPPGVGVAAEKMVGGGAAG